MFSFVVRSSRGESTMLSLFDENSPRVPSAPGDEDWNWFLTTFPLDSLNSFHRVEWGKMGHLEYNGSLGSFLYEIFNPHLLTLVLSRIRPSVSSV